MPTNIVSFSKSISPIPLFSGENIIFQKRPNFLIPSSLIVFLWIIGASLFWAFYQMKLFKLLTFTNLETILYVYIGVFLFVGLCIFLSWYKTIYTLTNKRIEWTFGVIGQGAISIPLDHIENIYLKYSIIGRIFNFGNITIEPAGLSTRIIFSGISDAKNRKKDIETALP